MLRQRSILFLIQLGVLSIGLLACRRETFEPDGPPGQYSDYFWGEVSGSRNGISFFVPRVSGVYHYSPDEQWCYANTCNVQITEFDNGGTQRTQIFFSKVPKNPGTYRDLTGVAQTCAKDSIPSVRFYLLEGDALLNTYLPIAAGSNSLTILSFDEKTTEIRGSFDFTAVAERITGPNDPDTVRCTGQFHTKLRKADQTFQ